MSIKKTRDKKLKKKILTVVSIYFIFVLTFASINALKTNTNKSTKKTTHINNTYQHQKEENTYTSSSSYTLKFGQLLDEYINEDTLVIKAKIEPSYKNSATINQNGFNVEDIVKNQGGDQFKEIQYWAVADMSDGSEDKVISFTLNEELIESIKNGNTVGNQIVDKAQDVWILPSLQY